MSSGRERPKREDVKVVLQCADGTYLAGGGHSLLVHERAKARVFNYFADEVEQLITNFRDFFGLELRSVALPASDVYECCDLCQRLIMPREAFFDGARFLCPDCKAKAGAD